MGDQEIEEKCICQLCNCGMHQCSHMDSIPSIHSTDSKSMNGSEYSEMYETKNVVARTKPFYPDENNLKPEFVYPTTISTHADDFKAWQVQKPIIFKPNAINMTPTGEFSAETTNRSEFTMKKPSKVKSIKPSSTGIVRQVEPFTASSTQKSDFNEKKAQRTKSFKPASSYERNYDPLNALSVSKADYIPLELNKTKILKPKSRQHSSNAPFEGTTEQRSNFNAKRVEVVHGCRPNTQYRVMSGPAETETTYSLGYKAVQGGRQQPFKPPQVQKAPEGDFDGITTTKADFIQKRNKICPAEYVLSRRNKNFRIRSGADGHRFYTRIRNDEE